MIGIRAKQKEKTRRSLIEAAFSQLSAERSFTSLSLREVAREAGIAPTSFYRHFRDVDELGLTMVDESGLMLRQLMRQARQRIAKGGSVIRTSVSTFMEFIGNNPNAFRLLLRERSGTSAEFRAAVAREIQHFIAELADYLEPIPKGIVILYNILERIISEGIESMANNKWRLSDELWGKMAP
ncbi:HTH-type transcriptional repressor FabR, partial [Photorhabdus kayaii]|uniref:HTH-type transcriptional repressor FabR n=1 Tax=Photorhabdus kayaii TaxID=230088 RepID=UPI00292A51F8